MNTHGPPSKPNKHHHYGKFHRLVWTLDLSSVWNTAISKLWLSIQTNYFLATNCCLSNKEGCFCLMNLTGLVFHTVQNEDVYAVILNMSHQGVVSGVIFPPPSLIGWPRFPLTVYHRLQLRLWLPRHFSINICIDMYICVPINNIYNFFDTNSILLKSHWRRIPTFTDIQ